MEIADARAKIGCTFADALRALRNGLPVRLGGYHGIWLVRDEHDTLMDTYRDCVAQLDLRTMLARGWSIGTEEDIPPKYRKKKPNDGGDF